MQLATQISIAIPNIPSSLAVVGDKLRSADVNISAISCTDVGATNIVHLIVSDPETAKIVLADVGQVTARSVISATLKNKPGAIAGIGRSCAAAGVNIKNLYATTCGKESMVYIDTDDNVKSLELLKKWKGSMA